MSNQLYHIIPLTQSKFLVVAKSWSRPEFFLADLAKELKALKNGSVVLFDFLVKNGLKDRFFKAKFNSDKCTFSSLTSTKVDSEIKLKANDFFAHNSDLLNSSFLTPAQKYLFQKELACNCALSC